VQAQASNNAAAQTLFDTARALMKKGNYAEACPKLEESQRLDPGSGTLLNLGICYEHLGLTASAWTTFIDAAAAAKAAGKADRVKSAQQHADALAPRLTRITIKVTSNKISGLEVRRDGTVVRAAQWGTAIAADPGPHVIAATATGHKAWQTTVNLQDTKSETVIVPELEALAPTKSAKAEEPAKTEEGATKKDTRGPADSAETNAGQGQRTVALIAGGVGVVGVAVGTVFGFRSKSAHDDAAAHCNGLECDSQGVDLSNKARTAGNVSTGAFILGGVGLAAAGVLWFTAPHGNSVEVGLGIGTMQIAGTW
jgi:serine/threonine-protein kinase